MKAYKTKFKDFKKFLEDFCDGECSDLICSKVQKIIMNMESIENELCCGKEDCDCLVESFLREGDCGGGDSGGSIGSGESAGFQASAPENVLSTVALGTGGKGWTKATKKISESRTYPVSEQLAELKGLLSDLESYHEDAMEFEMEDESEDGILWFDYDDILGLCADCSHIIDFTPEFEELYRDNNENMVGALFDLMKVVKDAYESLSD